MFNDKANMLFQSSLLSQARAKQWMFRIQLLSNGQLGHTGPYPQTPGMICAPIFGLPCVFGPKVEEDDEGFDLRILAVLALPLFGISWALFNVWRVAFRQVVRIGESAKGNPL